MAVRSKARIKEHEDEMVHYGKNVKTKPEHVQPDLARIAQLVAYRLGTGEVPGSNTGKGKNFSLKISK